MSRIPTNYPVYVDTFVPGGTIGAGKPVGTNLQLAAANTHILGIAMQDCVVTDLGCEKLVIGVIDVTAGGAITRGDYVKVGTAGKFLTADATAFAAGQVVGKAMSTVTADGDIVSILVGMI